MYQDSAGVKAFHYIHTDYLGSWLKITNGSGAVENTYSYDAWGRPRNPVTWDLRPISINDALVNLNAMQPRFDRGYTGHEHMAGFGLINMNGRLYDPYLQRFLSPDNVVQSPLNAQNYNRYSYCMNNPLMYTDPTGWQMASIKDFWILGAENDCFTNFSGSRSGGRSHGGGFGYTYNKYTGNYHDAAGNIVDWDEVYNNYILPNSVTLTGQSAIDFVKLTGKLGAFSVSTRGNNIIIDCALPSTKSISNVKSSLGVGGYSPQPFLGIGWGISGSNFNIQLAVNAMLANALDSFDDPNYKHQCGGALKDGLLAGLLNATIFPGIACGYKDFFEGRQDFQPIQDLKNYKPQDGDIVVFDCNNTHKWGHVAMWCGTQWVSDVRQGYVVLPQAYQKYGSGFMIYQTDIPTFTIFRYTGNNNYSTQDNWF